MSYPTESGSCAQQRQTDAVLDRVSKMCDSLSDVEQRLLVIRNRLLAPCAENPSTMSGPIPTRGGVLGQIHDRQDTAAGAVERIRGLVNEIDSI